MGCVLCNLIQFSEAHEPFPSESARQDFMNELAGDIAQNHSELVMKISECLARRRDGDELPKKVLYSLNLSNLVGIACQFEHITTDEAGLFQAEIARDIMALFM